MPGDDSSRESERRQATVLFADVSGLTSMSERMDPEDVTVLMNKCFAALEAAVHGHGGVVDKYIGDCIMALFGVPHAIEHAPRQAVNAAIEMRRRVEELNRGGRLAAPLEIHIGINTGLVIAGDVGGAVKRDFTVMGDAVNLASRLKDTSTSGQIFVGSETYRYTRDAFEYRKLKPLTLKGKENPVDAYELMSVAEQLYRAPVAASDRMIFSALVGRDAELQQLRQAFARLARGDGGILSVIGDAGIGKSRLIVEAMSTEEARPVTVLLGRSIAIGQTLSFHPFADLLRRWAGIPESVGDDEALRGLETALRELSSAEAAEMVPFIATLMGMRLTGAYADRIAGIEGEAMEALIFRSLRELFQRLADSHPIALVFEDLHWADQSSVQLLESLLRLVVDKRVLFILAFRPDYPASSQRILDEARAQHALQHRELHLRPLDDHHCGQLMRNLLQSEKLPHDTRALITRKAEGNPFYIEEVIRSLIDDGALEVSASGLRVTNKIESVVIPGTIQEVIMARVDRLDAASRRVLQVASVIGRSFYHRIIAAVMPEEPDLDVRLDYLEERQLLTQRRTRRTAMLTRRRFADELEYVFQHALAQETIYESILQRTRRELHARVAASIEAAFAERLPDFYGMLAYHYGRAENPEKAEEYLFRAGEEASRSAASSEGLMFFQAASRLYLQIHGDGGDPHKKALLERNIGLALMNTGNLAGSMVHFEQALAYLGDPIPRSTPATVAQFAFDAAAVLLRLYLPAWRSSSATAQTRSRDILQVRYPHIKAQSTADPTRLVFDYFRTIRWLNQTDPAAVPDQVVGLYSGFAAMFAYSGVSFRLGRRFLGISEKLIRPGNAKDLFDHGCLVCIHNYLEGKWSDEEGTVPGELVEQALRYGGVWEVNTYLGLDADRRLRRGDFAGANRRIDELKSIGDTYGFEFAVSNRDIELALLLLEERRLEEALTTVERYCAEVHDNSLRTLGLGSKAKVQVLQGDRDGAAATLDAAEQVVKRSRFIPPWHLSAYAVARLLYDIDALAAEPASRRASGWSGLAQQAGRDIAFAHKVMTRVAVQRAEVLRLSARLWWLLGRSRKAQRCWTRAIAECEHLGTLPELARTYADVGACLPTNGVAELDGISAAEYLSRARERFEDLGLAWSAAEAEARAQRAA